MSLVFFSLPRPRRSAGKVPCRMRPVVEVLEERTVPTLTTLTGPAPTLPAATPARAPGAFNNALFGTWSTAMTWVNVQAADINGAGIDSIIGRAQQTGQWWAANSDGTGKISSNQLLTTWDPSVNWVDVQVGDLYGNGRQEIIGRDQANGEWWVVAPTGSGFENRPLAQWSPGVTWSDVHVADLNGDGRADLVGRIAQTGQWFATASTATGWQTTLWATWSAGVPWVDVQVGDLTGDGQADIVGRNALNGQWFAGISNGSSFTTSLWTTWSTAYTWVDVKLADVGGTGKEDLVGRALQSGQWWVGENTGSGFANVLWATWAPTENWVDVQVGDFSNTGYLDIAGRDQATGQWWVGISSGNGFTTTRWTTWAPQAFWVNVRAISATTGSAEDIVGQDARSGQWWVALSNAPSDPNEGFIGDQLLNAVAATAASSGDAAAAAKYSKQLTFDAQHRVSLNVRATAPRYVASLEANAEALGLSVVTVNPVNSLIVGYLSPSAIDSLPNLLHFAAATANLKPHYRAGQVPSQGSPVILADSFRASTGLDGSGQTIGIISDSANQYNGGLAESYSVGALNANKVKVLQDGPSGSSDEGRAMMELAYDVAPGANLDFFMGGPSSQTAANAIKALTAAGATSIADDIFFVDEPFFNDGIFAQAVDNAVGNGVFYDTAAGNTGNQAYTANWKSFSGLAIGNMPITTMDFGGGNPVQTFSVSVGGFVDLDLQWDSAFLEGGSSLPNFNVKTSLYAYVIDPNTGQIFQSFTNNSQNTNEADQEILFTNPTTNVTSFGLVIALAGGPAPGVIKWINNGGDDPMAAGQGAPSIFGHSAASLVSASGAVSYNTPNTPDTTFADTALGGKIPILFDKNGNRLPMPDNRQKPDLVAADNVDVSEDIGGSLIDTDNDGWPNFNGTSATSPQVAAAAALMRQNDPAATPSLILQHFKSSAKVIGTAGFDPYSGSGLLQITPLVPTSGTGTGSTGTGGSGGLGPNSPASPPPPVPPILRGPANDQFEPNDTADNATNFGPLVGTEAFAGLTINGHLINGTPVYDQDWYRWTMATSGTFTATLSNIQADGGVFQERIFVLMPNNSLQQLAASPLSAATAQSIAANVSAGQTIFLWVYGVPFQAGSDAVGSYNFSVTLG
jgi:hypothetical protein